MAEQVGHQTPYQFQHLLGRTQWDADKVNQEVCQYVTEDLGREAGILAIDETGFIKQGTHSVGVQVQHCSLTGRLENCQVGVFLAYVSPQGHSLIDRRLFCLSRGATMQTNELKQAFRSTLNLPQNLNWQSKC